MHTPTKKPWWRRKRAWAAVALWLLAPPLYVLSSGPAMYLMNRDWIPVPVYRAVYGPLTYLMKYPGHETLANYGQWWLELAYEHELGSR